jgi:hypothetical protein
MRALWLLPALAAVPLAVGGWALASAGVVPTCTAKDRTESHLVPRGGYYLACGHGSAVVKFKGITYRMKGSRCFIGSEGARLYFGAQRASRPLPPPQNGLSLLVGPNREGAVEVSDGQLDLASGLRTAILGKGHATAKLKRGTFTIFGHLGSGRTDSRRFTGSWHCD